MLQYKQNCAYDVVSLGEVMLRFDPGNSRIRTAHSFEVWEGGGEYNVAKGLAGCFGLRTGVVTAFADNEIGRLAETLIRRGGVDTDLIQWKAFDGLGVACRNGLNFVERGFGIRGALGTSDRGHTAISQMRPEDVDWHYLFGTLGVRWFHTGGIFAGLSEQTAQTALRAVQVAKEYGTVVSFDLNYRPSLWKGRGGIEAATKVNRSLVPYADVVFGIEPLLSDFDNTDYHTPEELEAGMAALAAKYPHLSAIGATLRKVHTASRNDWTGLVWYEGSLYSGPAYENLEIFDRVGGGDGFAAGVIYGLLQHNGQLAADYGTAHGALAMTTPGDTSMATLSDVKKAAHGRAKVER